jgi:hypothetical protein
MKKISIALLFFVIQVGAFAQINSSSAGLNAQFYSKEITEYTVKNFIVKNILQVPDKALIDVKIDAITASGSGEITSVVYNCESQNKSGLIFAFWNQKFNENNTHFNEYSFKTLNFDQAKEFMNVISKTLSQAVINNGSHDNNNVIYKYDDMTFIFYYSSLNGNLIRVLWGDFDSAWSQSNFEITLKRFNKFFGLK